MKKVAYVVAGLVVGYLILCMFGPSSIKVERSIEIKNTSVDVMQHKLADLKFFHDEWSPWSRRDPGMKTTYSGECCQPGSSYAWDSAKDSVGKGSMTFNKFTGDSVLLTLHFDGMDDADVYYVTTANSENVKVTWGMSFKIGFFGRAPMLFMSMDKMIGPDYETGLAKLKEVVEASPAAPEVVVNYDIQETTWEARSYIGKKGTFKFSEMGAFFGDSYPKLGAYVVANNVELQGAPSAIYFKFDEVAKVAECAAVFKLKEAHTSKEWETFEIPASKVLVIDYYGPYEKSASAHYAMDAYMKEKGLTQGFVIEEYITDPMSEKDPSKWLTKIYYTLK